MTATDAIVFPKTSFLLTPVYASCKSDDVFTDEPCAEAVKFLFVDKDFPVCYSKCRIS